MNYQTLTLPLISFPEIMRSSNPREVAEKNLLSLLVARLKKAGIIWNPKAFRGGLKNKEVPLSLLKKIETLVSLAESIQWKLSKSLRDELDATIEDIETFNPSFRESLRRAEEDFRAGRFVTQDEFEKRYNLTS